MGLLDSAIQSDGEFTADIDQWSETITYTRASGATLTPKAIVDRNAPQRDVEYPVSTRAFDVWIPYDAGDDFGLSAEPAKGDRITLKNDPSDATTVAKEYRSMVTADTGGWLVVFA